MTNPTWTSEETASLMRGWKLGLSASEIRKGIPGKSRSAVLGKLHRLRESKQVADKPIRGL